MSVSKEQDWLQGVNRAWEIISSLSPGDVCRKTKADYDEFAGNYILTMFNEKVYISLKERCIWSDSKVANFILNDVSQYSILATLWYLIQAKNILLSESLISPGNMNGGQIFLKGSHVLPLDRIIEKYGNDIRGFLNRGIYLGGEQLNYADASFRLFPFPRIPLILLLWSSDGEFPARADILFDATCSEHLPTEIIWSTAMMSILLCLSEI